MNMGKSFCSIINKGTTSSLLTTELGDIGIKEKTFFLIHMIKRLDFLFVI